MKLPSLHPLQTINYLELSLACVAHVVTLRYMGLFTGAITGLAVHYAIGKQKDGKSPRTRQYAFAGVVVFKICQLWMHQVSFGLMLGYLDTASLPFGATPYQWAWFTTFFVFAIDIWALRTTSKEAGERADAQYDQESIDRMAREKREHEEAETARKRMELEQQIQLAKIQAEADTRKAEAEANAKAEATKAKAEARAEAVRAQAEAEARKAEVQAEARKREAEATERKAEADRKERKEKAEAEAAARKRTEDQAEAKRQAEVAQRAENERIAREKAAQAQREAEATEQTRKQEAEVLEATRKQQAEAEAEKRKRSPEVWRTLIAQAEAEIETETGRKATRAEVAARLGTSDRTVRQYANAA